MYVPPALCVPGAASLSMWSAAMTVVGAVRPSSKEVLIHFRKLVAVRRLICCNGPIPYDREGPS